MKAFLTGSAPVLILGGTPAGIVCAELLARHNIPVTLIGEGRPFGGRGRSLPGLGPVVPVWPFGYSRIPVKSPGEVSQLLAQAHAKGACVQPDAQLRRVEFDGERATEVVLEGLLGEVRRRPRFVIVASRADFFIERCANLPDVQGLSEQFKGDFHDGSVLHLSWPEVVPVPGPELTAMEISGWRCAFIAPQRKDGKGVHWACTPIDTADAISEEAVTKLTPQLLEASGVGVQGNIAPPKVTTRVIRDAVLEGANLQGVKGLDMRWPNVAFVGQAGCFESMSVEEEIALTRARVESWFRE